VVLLGVTDCVFYGLGRGVWGVRSFVEVRLDVDYVAGLCGAVLACVWGWIWDAWVCAFVGLVVGRLFFWWAWSS